MTGEEIFHLFETRQILRQELCCLIGCYTQSPKRWINLLCAVWIAIGEAPAGESDLYYHTLAYTICEREYRLKYKPPPYDGTERKQKTRRKRFFIKHAAKIVAM